MELELIRTYYPGGTNGKMMNVPPRSDMLIHPVLPDVFFTSLPIVGSRLTKTSQGKPRIELACQTTAPQESTVSFHPKIFLVKQHQNFEENLNMIMPTDTWPKP